MERSNSIGIVRAALKERKWTIAKLAEEAGYKSGNNVNGILNRGDSMRVDTFVRMMESMGYEIVVRDKMGSTSAWKVNDGKEVSE